MGGCFQMKKFVFFCLISFLFSGCGSHEVVSDIQLSDLRIKHVKRVGDDCALSAQRLHVIEISGPINPDTTLVVQRLINKIKSASNRCVSKESGRPYAVLVYLSSGGGYLVDGIELGRLFREGGVQVRVTYGAKCFSSCAVAFIGGFYRDISGNGELLFHAPYYSNSWARPSNCQTSNSELQSYFISMLGEENGSLLYNRTMSNCSSFDGWTINKDAAEIMGITTR